MLLVYIYEFDTTPHFQERNVARYSTRMHGSTPFRRDNCAEASGDQSWENEAVLLSLHFCNYRSPCLALRGSNE